MKNKKQVAQFLIRFSEQNPEKIPEIVEEFMVFFKKKGLDYQFSHILEIIEHMAKEKEEENKFQICLAQSVDRGLVQEIKRIINIPSAVKEDISINKNLKAGFVAYFRNTKYDGSAAEHLRQMKNKINNSF